jgi:DNA-binding FadR family transcriptional regulator
VDPRQGKGVYVTADQAAGFGTALLLALRRNGASVWDVEEFERLIFPEAAARVASRLKEVDTRRLRECLEEYGRAIEYEIRRNPGENWFTGKAREAWYAFTDVLFEMSGNKLLEQLGPAVARIRNVRSFDGIEDRDPERVSRRETRAIEKVIAAIETGIPGKAASVTSRLLSLPGEAEEVMKKTAVGEIPRIPVDLEAFLRESGV